MKKKRSRMKCWMVLSTRSPLKTIFQDSKNVQQLSLTHETFVVILGAVLLLIGFTIQSITNNYTLVSKNTKYYFTTTIVYFFLSDTVCTDPGLLCLIQFSSFCQWASFMMCCSWIWLETDFGRCWWWEIRFMWGWCWSFSFNF